MACRTPDAEALAIIRSGAERVVEVTDQEIEEAMRAIFDDTHNVAEGAGAAALAAVLRERDTLQGRIVGIALTGANVDAEVLAPILTAGLRASHARG